jgi:hypothetical protein
VDHRPVSERWRETTWQWTSSRSGEKRCKRRK